MVTKLLCKVAADQRGASAVEYGLLIGLMTVLLIAAVSATGVETGNHFNNVRNGFSG